MREYLSVLGVHQPHPFRVASHHEIDLFRVMQSSPSPRRFPPLRVPCGGIKTDRSIDLPIPALLFPALLFPVLLFPVLLSLVCWFPVLACPPAISAAGPSELEQVQDRVQDQVQVPSGSDQGSRLVPEKSVETGVADEGAAGERQSDSPLVEGAISWTGKDVHGREVRIPARSQNQLESPRAQVLIFLLHDCPVANSYAPEFRRIHDQFAQRGIAFHFVHVDVQLPAAQAQKHAADYQLPGSILVDFEHRLVSAVGATRVPEAAVISPRGELLYLGRIDDLYAGFGQRRAAPMELDLRNALQAILDDQQVPAATGEVVGCPIPSLSLLQRQPGPP